MSEIHPRIRERRRFPPCKDVKIKAASIAGQPGKDIILEEIAGLIYIEFIQKIDRDLQKNKEKTS